MENRLKDKDSKSWRYGALLWRHGFIRASDTLHLILHATEKLISAYKYIYINRYTCTSVYAFLHAKSVGNTLIKIIYAICIHATQTMYNNYDEFYFNKSKMFFTTSLVVKKKNILDFFANVRKVGHNLIDDKKKIL